MPERLHLDLTGSATILVSKYIGGEYVELISLLGASFAAPFDHAQPFSPAEQIPARKEHVVTLVLSDGSRRQWDVRWIDDGSTYATTQALVDAIKTKIDALGGGGGGGGGITQLTGNVTAGPGSGSQVATIANDAVTYAKLQNVNALSLVGNPTGAAADATNVSIGMGLAASGSSLIVDNNVVPLVTIYMATLTELSTVPIATEGYNNTGFTYTLSRSSAGVYTINTDGGEAPFTANKTMIRAVAFNGGNFVCLSVGSKSTSRIGINTHDATGAPIDPSEAIYIEVVVYP